MNLWFLSILYAVQFKRTDGVKESTDYTDLTPFPKEFIFSTATASYQVEGAWNVSGKGENIWDRIVHTNPNYIANGDNGDVACNSYYKYKEDVQNIKEIGFKMYRFSLSWSRLFPTGFVTTVNEDGVRYYSELIDELLLNNIEPMVTLYHWDLPQPLQDIGGWLSPDLPEIFGEYARAVFKLFGNRVKWWITINEPIFVTEGYGSKGRAPALNKHGVGEYLSGHNLLKAHAKAYRIYDNEFRMSQKGKVSLAIYAPYYYPKDPHDSRHVVAAERAFQFTAGWFAHPIFSESGDYPPVMRKYVDENSHAEGRQKSRLPNFTKEEIKAIQGTYDYFAINHYTSKLVQPGVPTLANEPSLARDQRTIQSVIAGSLKSECVWLRVTPEGFRALLNKIKKEYGNQEMFVTESGYCDNGKIEDKERIHYYTEYLKQLLKAIYEDGCRVIGYTAWSLMDNFEWNDGYTKKFGLIQVNFNDSQRPRIWKSSAKFFQQLIKVNSKLKNLKIDL